MGFEFWIWVVIAVITLIARAGRKKKVNSPRPRAKSGADRVEMDQARTFEELLREIENAKKVPSPENPPDTYRPTVVEHDMRQEQEDTASQGHIPRFDVQEQEFSSRPQLIEPPLSETEKTPLRGIDEKVNRIGSEKNDRENKLKSSVLASLFNSPDELKKAFVLTEVLPRKY